MASIWVIGRCLWWLERKLVIRSSFCITYCPMLRLKPGHQYCGVTRRSWDSRRKICLVLVNQFKFIYFSQTRHRKKRMRLLQKKIKTGDVNEDDPFEFFISATTIRWCYYHETHKI